MSFDVTTLVRLVAASADRLGVDWPVNCSGASAAERSEFRTAAGPANYYSAQGVLDGSAVNPEHSLVSNPQIERVSPALRAEVERAIDRSRSTWERFVAATTPDPSSGLPAIPLVLKYIPVERAKDFLPKPGGTAWPPPVPPPHPGSHPPYRSKGIFIGNKDYTWGRAVYVTGIHQPLSTATYGRVGLVSHIDLGRIRRVFDARVKANYKVYLKWLRSQRVPTPLRDRRGHLQSR